jgi:hypothetical protein
MELRAIDVTATLGIWESCLDRYGFERQEHHRPIPSLPKVAWLERPVLPDTPPRFADTDVDLAISIIAAQFVAWRNLCQGLAAELRIEHRELARLIFERLQASA